MQEGQGEKVFGRDGLLGTLESTSGEGVRTLVLTGGERVRIDEKMLQRSSDGWHLPLAERDLLEESTGIPIVEERISIGKQTVPREKVSVRIVPREEERSIDVDLEEETVEIERIAVNRIVDEPPRVREEAGVLVIPVLEEVLVVEKRLMVREEVRLSKRREVRHRRQSVTVRTEEAEVSREPVPMHHHS